MPSVELLLKFMFKASHSLAEYEEPHPHYWRLEIAVEGQPVDGMIIDIVKLRKGVEAVIQPLENTFLNDNGVVSIAVRKAPTCETLSEFFVESLTSLLDQQFLAANPSVRLASVMVAICDMDRVEAGAIKRTM